MAAYDRAISQTVFPGAVVADLGTGTGIMAMMACRHGAARVYAIEPASIIGVAREVVAANGFAERVSLLEGFSTATRLPERVDVLISDLRGVLPFHTLHIPSIVDARDRFLKDGGTLVPQRDLVKLALVEGQSLYRSHLMLDTDRMVNFDLSAIHDLLRNTWSKATIGANTLLSESGTIFDIDYRSVSSANAIGTMELTAARDGVAHGLALWFDATLADGVELTNAPGKQSLIYGQAFFPYAEPISLSAGQQVRVELQARLVGDHYIWRWKTLVDDRGSGRRIAFDQSTFFATPFSPQRLARNAESFVCSLSGKGLLDRAILMRMDGTRTNRQIAEELAPIVGSYASAFEQVTRVADEFGA